MPKTDSERQKQRRDDNLAFFLTILAYLAGILYWEW